MNKVTEILQKVNDGIPMALARFNDGECGIIFNKDFTAARGDQKGSIELQIALIDAILHEQENYFKGYPCEVCYPELLKKCVDAGYFNPDYAYNTKAVVNTNRNLEEFSPGLISALQGKQVVWVSGDDQIISSFDGEIDILNHIKVQRKNSWRCYNSVLQQCLRLVSPHRVFLFSLGPTSRVLVRNLFQLRPDASYLDIGDTYSPVTRGVWRKCHTGKLKRCRGCN